jgi:hypothetical protein
MSRNSKTEKYPRLPIYKKVTLHGNKNEISRSKIINKIETK